MNWELAILFTGVMLFSYWINYAMGGPLSDDERKVDVGAILFFIPKWLAIRRLKKIGIFHEALSEILQELAMTKNPRTRKALAKDKKRDLYLSGREFFTWERSFLCAICFHFWLTLLVGLGLIWFDALHARADFFIGVFYYLGNHFFIRKIS